MGFQVLSEPLNATGEGADLNRAIGVRVMASCLFDLGLFSWKWSCFSIQNAERIILGRPKVAASL